MVISAGCHAGYNIVDADGVPGVTLGLDWAEEMARQHATFIGGTGYQYADTDFVAYSAKLYTLLASQLRTGLGPCRHRAGTGQRQAGVPRRRLQPHGHRPEGTAGGDALRPADGRRSNLPGLASTPGTGHRHHSAGSRRRHAGLRRSGLKTARST